MLVPKFEHQSLSFKKLMLNITKSKKGTFLVKHIVKNEGRAKKYKKASAIFSSRIQNGPKSVVGFGKIKTKLQFSPDKNTEEQM